MNLYSSEEFKKENSIYERISERSDRNYKANSIRRFSKIYGSFKNYELIKSTSSILMEHNSDMRIPVAKSSSMIAIA